MTEPHKAAALLALLVTLGTGAGARAATGATRPAHGFVPGRTSRSADSAAGEAPAGFEESAGVTVKKQSRAADLAADLRFEVVPGAVEAGDEYTVKVYFVNEGSAPLQVTDMRVTTTLNGRKRARSLPPQTRDVAPGQKGLLLASSDSWKKGTATWAMEVVVRTARGETYKNLLSWK